MEDEKGGARYQGERKVAEEVYAAGIRWYLQLPSFLP